MSLPKNIPRATPSESVTEILHGIAVTDPYRWLEEQNSPRTRKWIEEQTKFTRAYLDTLPERDRIRKRVEELLTVEVTSDCWKVANRYFYLKRSSRQEQPAILMRDGNPGREIVLVDPTKQWSDSAITVKIMSVSRSGRLLAYGIRTGADSLYTVEFLDVDKKRVLPDCLARGSDVQVQFSPDERGFYYSHRLLGAQRPDYRAAYWHEFGTKSEEDVELFAAGEDPQSYLRLLTSMDGNGHLLGYLVIRSRFSKTFDLYVQNVLHNERAEKLLEGIEPLFEPFFVGDQLFALTDYQAPNLRIVAIDLAHPGRQHWVDVVPQSESPIKDFAFLGNSVCVGYVQNASSQIEIFDRTGHWQRSVPCPPLGSAQLIWNSPESDALFYKFSSLTDPPTIFCYQISNDQQTVWASSPVKFDPSAFQIEHVRYKSKDGTQVPMYLVALKGKRGAAPLPTFLGAYGGFGTSRTPQFNAYSTFLIEHGFLFAFASIRGGGDFGEEWHRAGKRHNRQKAFDDFIAAAEWLIAQGHTTSQKLAIGGGSNAGLLVGAALTQRPDLFRLAVCVGPLLDMLRYHRFDSAYMFVDAYGTADKEDDFLYLRAYSPYHHVKNGVAYPSVMLVSGDQDTCCNPMHARKMAARLQEATTSERPILLDYKPTWGHVSVQPLPRRIEALSDRLAFICHELGVTI